MHKQDIINRLNTAKDFGGSWAFVKAQGRISQLYAIYEVADYPFDHYEVVQFSLGYCDKIVTTLLLSTESIQEAIERFAICAAN